MNSNNRLFSSFLVSAVFILYITIGGLFSYSYAQSDSVKIQMSTNKGDVVLYLYPETPIHQQNFIKLVDQKFYEGVLFHRVMRDFMAQAGDPNSKNEQYTGSLGKNSEGESIPAEFKPKYFHKKGALAAARQPDNINPTKSSSGSQFYIVQGKVHTKGQLQNMEARINAQKEGDAIKMFLQKEENVEYLNFLKKCQKENLRDSMNITIEKIKPFATKEMELFKFSKQAIIDYTTIGGTPHLDGGYTVFGEIIKGLEVVDTICNIDTFQNNRPKEDVKIISMFLIK